MAQARRLLTDADFLEALEQRYPVRVFREDHMIDSGSFLIRFDDRTIVLQASVSEATSRPR